MDEKTKTELALFRFSLIAPLVNGSCEKSQKEYLEEICAKRYDVPGLGYREFSTATVKGWLSLYRRYGLEGLKRKPRNDRGTFRHLSSEAQAFIKESLKASPEQTAIKIHQDALGSATISQTLLAPRYGYLPFHNRPLFCGGAWQSVIVCAFNDRYGVGGIYSHINGSIV